MAQRSSSALSRTSLDVPSDALTDQRALLLGNNPRSVAYLVYANRGDPYSSGYKTPTTSDIPQIKLPRVEKASSSEIAEYVESVRISGKDTQRSDQHRDANEREVPPLNTVPEVFFNNSFQSNNPRIFDAVIGEGDASVTQEKLSWYVDIVEAHSAQEIAHASTQFFEATAQFTAIEDQARTTSKSVKDFVDVVSAQQKVVEHYQETAELQHKSADANEIVQSIDYSRKISLEVSELERSAENDIAEGLSKLRFLQTALKDNKTLDIRRVSAAQPLLERVEIAENSLKTRIRTKYASQMISASHLAATKNATKDESSVSSQEYDEAIANATQSLEFASSLGASEACIKQYRSEIDREVKLVVRRNLPINPSSSNQSSNPEESQFSARSLHASSPEDAETMCRNIFSQSTDLLVAIQQQNISDSGQQILDEVVKGADSRLARVLRVRKDPATSSSPPQFIRFFAQITEFCDFIEGLSSVKASEIREFLVAQTKLYVHCLHESLDSTLSVTMEADDWRKAEISSRTQKFATWISAAALTDPPVDEESLVSPPPSREVTPSTDQNSAEPNVSQRGSFSRLEIESQPFLVSKSAVHLIKDLVSFLMLISYLPPAQSISAGRATVELLQLFNHKTYTQVIGHGAIKTAGLRHINIRNLSLAHECLRMVENLLSPLRKCVERHSGINGLSFSEDHSVRTASTEILQLFDSVQQKYFDHRSEIQHRLVKLLSDKAVTAAKHILNTDWNNPKTPELAAAAAGETSSSSKDDHRMRVSSYMIELMRQTGLVSRVAQEMLPASIAEDIITSTYASYKAKSSEAYSGLTISTALEKRNVLRDVNYFRSKSADLKGAGNTGDVIYETVNNFVAPEIDVSTLDADSQLPGDDDRRDVDQSLDQSIDQTIYAEQPSDTEMNQSASILSNLQNENSPIGTENSVQSSGENNEENNTEHEADNMSAKDADAITDNNAASSGDVEDKSVVPDPASVGNQENQNDVTPDVIENSDTSKNTNAQTYPFPENKDKNSSNESDPLPQPSSPSITKEESKTHQLAENKSSDNEEESNVSSVNDTATSHPTEMNNESVSTSVEKSPTASNGLENSSETDELKNGSLPSLMKNDKIKDVNNENVTSKEGESGKKDDQNNAAASIVGPVDSNETSSSSTTKHDDTHADNHDGAHETTTDKNSLEEPGSTMETSVADTAGDTASDTVGESLDSIASGSYDKHNDNSEQPSPAHSVVETSKRPLSKSQKKRQKKKKKSK